MGAPQPPSALDLWDRFCIAHEISMRGVELFACDSRGVVATKSVGAKKHRTLLMRSQSMEDFLIRETDRLVDDWHQKLHHFDGLIYLMFRKSPSNSVLPLYIGKTETLGRNGGNLSENISNLRGDKGKFARWGDGRQYHIGDLSDAVFNPQNIAVPTKYRAWALELFDSAPSDLPCLKAPVYFWCKAWKPTHQGVWQEMNPTRLAFLEYLLIGVASSAFPEILLNREGSNRVGFTATNKRPSDGVSECETALNV